MSFTLGTQRQRNVTLISVRCHDVAATSVRCHLPGGFVMLYDIEHIAFGESVSYIHSNWIALFNP